MDTDKEIVVDQDQNKKIMKMWDGMADFYEKQAEPVTVQAFI